MKRQYINDNSFKPIPLRQWAASSLKDYPANSPCRNCRKAMGCPDRRRTTWSCLGQRKR